jgi:hypothetical protein
MAENGGSGSHLESQARDAARRAQETARGVARDVEERIEGIRRT